MSAIDNIDQLMQRLEAALMENKLDLPDNKKELVKWIVQFTFNFYLPGLANLKDFLEGKSSNLTLLEALYSSCNEPVSTRIA